MSWLAPPKLLTGVAIDDPADPHLAVAGHVRMFANPRLGLPVGPIVVSRSTSAKRCSSVSAATTSSGSTVAG